MEYESWGSVLENGEVEKWRWDIDEIHNLHTRDKVFVEYHGSCQEKSITA